jgi:hypothetical protein
LNFSPQIKNNPVFNPLTSSNTWTKVYGEYIANGNERFILIGNFFDDLQTDTTDFGFSEPLRYSYHFIEDVEIVLCESNNTSAIENKLDFEIYPNPCSHNFNILSKNTFDFEVLIYDTKGTLVLNKIFSELNSQSTTSINISFLKNGMHYIIINTFDNQFKYKLIINH